MPGFGEATDIALQPDGKIVAVGDNRIARYTADGEPDTGFGTGGSVVMNVFNSNNTIYDTLEAVTVQPNGQIIVAGSSQDGANSPTQNDIIVARYDVNGALDPTFGNGGTVVTDIEGGATAPTMCWFNRTAPSLLPAQLQ